MWARNAGLILGLALATASPANGDAAVTGPTDVTTAAAATTATPKAGSLHGLLSASDERRTVPATAVQQDAAYARPFVASLQADHVRTALGGYMEMNSNYFVEDGIREGFSFEFRRFNLFVYTAIAEWIQFLSELEFEHGAEEIALETAQLDFTPDPRFNLRAGILLPPLGRFNANHDAPRYDFVERPWVSTLIIPSTLSEVGAGAYGRFDHGAWTATYDIYAHNGLGAGVVGGEARTFIPAGKSEEAFAEDNNGRPALSARVALARRNWGELGLSTYTGIYNEYRADGERIAPKRRLTLAAIDWDVAIYDLTLQGEAVWAWIDVPPSLNELFGERQRGFYIDLIYPVYDFTWLGRHNAVVNVAARIDRVDFNVGDFSTGPAAGDKIFDKQTALAVGIALRPVADTVVRLNYRREWHRDILGNPAIIRSGIQAGVATYF